LAWVPRTTRKGEQPLQRPADAGIDERWSGYDRGLMQRTDPTPLLPLSVSGAEKSVR
jgi:hypothetical protein